MPGGREEYRLTLRSLYLLDRLLVCCSNWSTMLPDDLLFDTRIASLKLSDEDATIWTAKLLGANAEYSLQRSMADELAPWQSGSTFEKLATDMQRLEPYFEASTCSLLELNAKQPATDEAISSWLRDEPVFLHVLHHVNYCLLYHPFLLQQRYWNHAKSPPTFLSQCVAKSRRHAAILALILGVIRSHSSVSRHALFGYAAMLAGSILRVHASLPGDNNAAPAQELLQACVAFLDANPQPDASIHRSYGQLLRSVKPSLEAASQLLHSAGSAPLDDHLIRQMWELLDHGAHSDYDGLKIWTVNWSTEHLSHTLAVNNTLPAHKHKLLQHPFSSVPEGLGPALELFGNTLSGS